MINKELQNTIKLRITNLCIDLATSMEMTEHETNHESPFTRYSQDNNYFDLICEGGTIEVLHYRDNKLKSTYKNLSSLQEGLILIGYRNFLMNF